MDTSTGPEFGDFVARGLEIRTALDGCQWALGDLGAAFEFSVGRPGADGEDTPTLGDLAAAWGLSAQTVSTYVKTARFFDANLRTLGDLGFSFYDLARRRAGDDVEVAMEYLTIATEQAFSYRQFKRYLEDIWWEGEVYERELPPRLHGIMPTGTTKAWITIEKVRE